MTRSGQNRHDEDRAILNNGHMTIKNDRSPESCRTRKTGSNGISPGKSAGICGIFSEETQDFSRMAVSAFRVSGPEPYTKNLWVWGADNRAEMCYTMKSYNLFGI